MSSMFYTIRSACRFEMRQLMSSRVKDLPSIEPQDLLGCKGKAVNPRTEGGGGGAEICSPEVFEK